MENHHAAELAHDWPNAFLPTDAYRSYSAETSQVDEAKYQAQDNSRIVVLHFWTESFLNASKGYAARLLRWWARRG